MICPVRTLTLLRIASLCFMCSYGRICLWASREWQDHYDIYPDQAVRKVCVHTAPREACTYVFEDRKSLVIDVRELSKTTSDAALLSSLARQTGYWPVFSVFNSLNNLVDLASVGLIGQKGQSPITSLDPSLTIPALPSWLQHLAKRAAYADS